MKFTLKPPKKRNVLIWDLDSEKFAKAVLDEKDVTYVPVRREEVNLFILLKTLLKGKIRTIDYYLEFIKSVNPKIVLTFIDNNLTFYKLRKYLNIPTAFVQSGNRTSFDDIFGKLEKLNNNESKDLKVDMMFVFNDATGEKYKKYISGDYIKIGSIMNNNFLIKKSINKTLLYISNFRTVHLNKTKKVHEELTWPDILKTEGPLVRFLHSYAIKNNLDFCILGKYSDDRKKIEHDYYSEFIETKDWLFVNGSSDRMTYKIIDEAKIVTGTQSTLLMESLSRHKKTIFFGVRPNIYPINSKFFGHLSKLKKSGPFWVNEYNEETFKKVLDDTLNISVNNLTKNVNNYNHELTAYDSGNSILKEKIKKYLK
tara:strand:- start:40 stop:1146 length:1107 start_codon:yes stop_codon:yes gene_type:complete